MPFVMSFSEKMLKHVNSSYIPIAIPFLLLSYSFPTLLLHSLYPSPSSFLPNPYPAPTQFSLFLTLLQLFYLPLVTVPVTISMLILLIHRSSVSATTCFPLDTMADLRGPPMVVVMAPFSMKTPLK